MRNAFLFVISACLLHFLQAQEASWDELHALIKSGTSKGKTPQASVTEYQLIARLRAPLTPAQRTDILFEISRGYISRLKVDSALHFAYSLKSLADTTDYKPALPVYHLVCGMALFLRNKEEECIGNLQKAIALFIKYKMPRYEGLSYFQMARMYSLNFAEAASIKACYWKALPLIAVYGSDKELHQALHHFGLSLLFACELDSASYYMTGALRMAENAKNKVMIFEDASDLGDVFMAAGALEEAGKYLRYAIDNYEQPANSVALRSTLFNYCEYLILTNQYDKAEKVLGDAAKLSVEFGDAVGPLTDKKLRGLLNYQKGNYFLASTLLREAYNSRDEITDFEFEAKDIALSLGHAELKAGQFNDAIRHLHHARDLSRKFRFVSDEIESDRLLAEAFQRRNNLDSSYYYFRSSAVLKDSLNEVKKQKAITEITTRYEVEKKEQQINNLKRDQKISDYQLALAKKASQLQSAVAAKEKGQKNLAIVIIGAIFLVSAFGFYRYRQNKKLSTQLSASLIELKEAQEQLIKTEKEKEAENLRLHISRDIHDEIASTLSGVALLSEIAKQKLQQNKEEDAGEYLEHISVNSKEMVEKMSDIIWTINPRNDSFERILFKLQSYALSLCAGKGIHFHYAIEEELMDISPSMQDRKNIYLLVKEAINNAVKYSNAANIDFSIRKENKLVQLEIKDDGSGFIPRTHTGNGIYNMYARAKELNGSLQIDSTEGSGTAVRLQFNFHPIEVQP